MSIITVITHFLGLNTIINISLCVYLKHLLIKICLALHHHSFLQQFISYVTITLKITLKIIIVMHKFLGFMGRSTNNTGICGLGGLGYLKYYEYTKINKDIEKLIQSNDLGSHLYETSQESAFSIDTVMDSFERKYNQFAINSYRQTLAGMGEGKVLETCAGSNRNLKFYKPQLDLTLIDYSPNMVSQGSSKISPLIKYKYVLGDVMQMPFKDNQFDYVIDTFGLEYVLNPHKALEEMRRVCKKDGRVLLMNEGLSSILQFHYWQNMRWGYNLIRGGYFSNRNWDKLVKQFDFQIEHEERKKNGRLYIYVLKNSKKGKEGVNEQN